VILTNLGLGHILVNFFHELIWSPWLRSDGNEENNIFCDKCIRAATSGGSWEAGLPVFSWYNLPTWRKIYQIATKYIKWP
jgi:hypothetical protein